MDLLDPSWPKKPFVPLIQMEVCATLVFLDDLFGLPPKGCRVGRPVSFFMDLVLGVHINTSEMFSVTVGKRQTYN